MPMLAGDEVRFVGEPVAVVIADDPYVAEDAAEVLDIEWTPLPAISSRPRRRLQAHARCTTN